MYSEQDIAVIQQKIDEVFSEKETRHFMFEGGEYLLRDAYSKFCSDVKKLGMTPSPAIFICHIELTLTKTHAANERAFLIAFLRLSVKYHKLFSYDKNNPLPSNPVLNHALLAIDRFFKEPAYEHCMRSQCAFRKLKLMLCYTDFSRADVEACIADWKKQIGLGMGSHAKALIEADNLQLERHRFFRSSFGTALTWITTCLPLLFVADHWAVTVKKSP